MLTLHVCVCVRPQKEECDPEEIRRQMELQLEAWHKLAPGTQEEVRLTHELCSQWLSLLKKTF